MCDYSFLHHNFHIAYQVKVLAIDRAIDPRKGAGPYSLPPASLKSLAPYIYKTILKFSNIVMTHQAPLEIGACSAYIFPIHKKGSLI